MQRRRRLKPPVISRLTWAWLCACAVFVGLVGLFARDAMNGGGVSRIALPVDQLEIFARAPEPALRRGAPALRDGGGANADGPALPVVLTGNEAFQSREENGLVLIYPGEKNLFAQNDQEYPGDALGAEEYAELDYPDDNDLADDYADGEYVGDGIIIRMPGRRSQAVEAQAASLRLPARSIPDPDPNMLRATKLGKVPRIAPDGRKALSVYARSFDAPKNLPRVSLIVGGLGLNAAVTERAIDDLPADVSLSFAPYAKNLDFWTRKARLAGHEVMIELPMEGYGANNQALGAASLLSSRSAGENLQRLDWLMSRFGGYVAATNYMGAKFSANEEALAPILSKLKESGVGYVDDTGAAIRAGGGVAMATVARVIPAGADEADKPMIKRELALLEQLAARDGAAIGKTYAYPAAIDEIVAWSLTLEEKGLAPAPVSALLQANAAAR